MSVLNKENLKLETLSLFQKYQKTGDNKLRDRIVELNLGLVRREAHHWVNQCRENYEDLVQVGCIGLIRAINRFDSSKGHAFSSFAIPCIRGEIQHYLRDKGYTVRIPRPWLDLGRQATNVRRDFQSLYNRQPNDTEISLALNISPEEWQEVKLAFQNREPLSLDAMVNSDEDNNTCLKDLVPDPRYRSFQLCQEDCIRLQQALAQLEDKTRHILEFVFLKDLTQRETAEQLGISIVTVSRRMKKGLETLRETMIQEAF
ncbi:RNA polymerase sigma factor SigF [Microcystis aeruginosa]|uniref:RNA polymerase sigma factor SigF n=1 Tax=Microcystis aeruginosa TaxID=1126 RepID=UPI00232D61D4|nr:RNA polymerase sigma factor SigF [Microcystis aeruginosa]MDB9418769.1 RNA polymerase sigma factor SigF [Microcystis aeruginosa CS-556/03]